MNKQSSDPMRRFFNFLSRGGTYSHDSVHSSYTKKSRNKIKNRVGYKERRKRHRQHMAHLKGKHK